MSLGEDSHMGEFVARHVLLEYYSANTSYPLLLSSFEESYGSKKVVGWPLIVLCFEAARRRTTLVSIEGLLSPSKMSYDT